MDAEGRTATEFAGREWANFARREKYSSAVIPGVTGNFVSIYFVKNIQEGVGGCEIYFHLA